MCVAKGELFYLYLFSLWLRLLTWNNNPASLSFRWSMLGPFLFHFILFFYKWLKKQIGSKICQICSWLCVLFQVVESQANKEKLQEHPLSFRAAENKIMHLGGDIPNYISRTWVMTQEGDPEVMEITSLKAFIVVAAGPQSPRTC